MIQNFVELTRAFRNRRLSAFQLKQLRERKLRTVIRSAYEHVPYYRALFRSAGLSPEDIRTVEDLTNVPITTKDDLRTAGIDKITAGWVDLSSCVERRTSGTSGKPFTIYRTQKEHLTAQIIMMASQIAFGFRPWDRFASLGPELFLPVHFYHRLGLYRRDHIPIRLPLDVQIQRLREFQPTIIMTWPSALRALIHHLGYPLRELVNPKLLVTDAEVFDDVLKKRVEEEVDSELLSCYVAHEVVQVAMECRSHEGLHVQADQLILESLNDGKPARLGQQGVAVITSLYSFAMPFIRYDLGDLIVLSDRKCSCGCSFPLTDPPRGRANDILKLPSGKVLSPQGFNHIFRGFSGIDQWRVIQERDSHFVLKLVMPQKPGEEFLRNLRAQFLAYLEEPVTLDIQLVNYMEDEAGKFKFFISKVGPSDS